MDHCLPNLEEQYAEPNFLLEDSRRKAVNSSTASPSFLITDANHLFLPRAPVQRRTGSSGFMKCVVWPLVLTTQNCCASVAYIHMFEIFCVFSCFNLHRSGQNCNFHPILLFLVCSFITSNKALEVFVAPNKVQSILINY